MTTEHRKLSQHALVTKAMNCMLVAMVWLHRVLQVAFGRTDSHLYEFRYKDIEWGVPDHDFGSDICDASKTTLLSIRAGAGC